MEELGLERSVGSAASAAYHSRMVPSQSAKILIVDDHPLIVEALSARLGAQPDMVVCGTAYTVANALAILDAEMPDLAIVDLVLQDGHGLDLIKAIARGGYPTKVLVLSAYDESIYAERALRVGAHGYVNKRDARSNVVEAARAILSGHRYLSEEMREKLVRQALEGRKKPGLSIETLTDRELVIFEMIGRGLSTRRIATRLKISIHTVESHREKIRHKLGLNDGTELMQRAVEWRVGQAS